jgi:hypothetical protein
MYCTRADLESIVGIGNVRQWADLDNDDADGKIATRITAVISDAQDEVDGVMVGGVYAVPFTEPAPSLVRRATALLAISYLQSARGIEDDQEGRSLSYREMAMSLLIRIRDGAVRLLDLDSTLSLPEVLEEDDDA